MAHHWKPFYGRKNLAKISCDFQHSMAHPRKTFYRRKNFVKISYVSGDIVHFVSNVVAMAKSVGQWKMRLAAFAGPSPTTLLWVPKFRKNFLHKPSYSSFCQKNSLPWQRVSVGEKCDWQHSMAHSWKTSINAKILKNFLRKPHYSPFCLVSVGEKCGYQHSMAHFRKLFKGAKISQKSFTEAEF